MNRLRIIYLNSNRRLTSHVINTRQSFPAASRHIMRYGFLKDDGSSSVIAPGAILEITDLDRPQPTVNFQPSGKSPAAGTALNDRLATKKAGQKKTIPQDAVRIQREKPEHARTETDMSDDQAALLDIVGDENHACVERGKAIEELCQQHGIRQVQIAQLTNRSTGSISHLKTCFLKLKGEARTICMARTMNAAACYLLAQTNLEQERVLALAKEHGKIRDSSRPEQNIGPRGKQSPPGQITEQDMKNALRDAQDRRNQP